VPAMGRWAVYVPAGMERRDISPGRVLRSAALRVLTPFLARLLSDFAGNGMEWF